MAKFKIKNNDGTFSEVATVEYVNSQLGNTGNDTTYTLTKSGSTITLTGSDGSATSVTDTDTNTTYSTGTASTAGLTKLYTSTGTSTDGTITRKAITAELDGKVPTTRTVNGKALSGNITLSASDVGADASGAANTALTNAKSYTDTALSTAKSYTDTSISNLINGAPTTLDTLGEIATAMADNVEVVEALETSIGNKADKSAIPTKVSQLTNDSGYKTTDTNTTYTISKSGSTITLTGSDGKTSTVTDSDTNTTYSAATTSANGLMTSAMVTKLNGIETGAEVNQNAFSNVTVGSTTIAADGKTDTLTLVAGSNVTLTPDATNDKITIAATNTVYTHPTSAGNKHIPAGGSSGQILRWSADGTAAWGADNNTTYSAATTSAAGLMSAADKTKLDGIATGANNYTYTLPTASSSTLGGVKTTSTVTSNSGYTACPIISGVPYYKDTNTTYSLSSFGITATAAELNYVDGVTSNIQTQLNGKAASSHGTHVTWSTTTPKAAGTAAIGSETNVARGDHVHPAQTTITGNAGSATKLATARNITLDTAVNATATSFNGTADITIPVTSVKESYLTWGGKNLVGEVSPIGASLSSEHSANRLAFLNPAALTIEYSNDGGSTWTDAGLTDQVKVNFVTTSTGIGVGSASTVTTNHRTRVLLTAQNGTTGYVYTRPRKMLLNISTAGHGLQVTVEYKTGVSGASWKTLGTYALSGWSGWNDIPLGLGTLGGGTTQTGNNWYLRLTFATTSVHSSYTTTKSTLISMRIFGDTSWTSPSTMATTGHLYTYDYQQNAGFPNGVSAKSFTENGTALSSKYAAKSHTHSYATVHTGTGTPAASLGNNGDIYIVTG